MNINEEQILAERDNDQDRHRKSAAMRARAFGVESAPEEWSVVRCGMPLCDALATVCLLQITPKWRLAFVAQAPFSSDCGMYITHDGWISQAVRGSIGYGRTIKEHPITSTSDLAEYLFPAQARARASAITAPDFKSLVDDARRELEQWDQQIAGLPPDPPRAPARTLAHAGVLVPLIIVFMLIVVMIGAML